MSDISRRSRHSICQSFFPAQIYNIIQIHSGETSRPRDFGARSVTARPCALKLASITFFMRGQLVASLCGFQCSLLLIHFCYNLTDTCLHCYKEWHKIYPICDAPLWRSARHSFHLLQKSRRNYRSHVRTEAVFRVWFSYRRKSSLI